MLNDRRLRWIPRLALAASLLSAPPLALASSTATPPPLPAPAGTIVSVSSEAQLQTAVQRLASNTTIVLARGTYRLTSTLWINGTFSNVTLRGATNNGDDVVLQGPGMTSTTSSVNFGIWVGGNVQGVTIANLTVRDIPQHPIIFNAGTQSPRVYNVHLINAGQQFIKSNPAASGAGVSNGIVEYSVIEYSSRAKDGYTNGVDVHGGTNWIVRHNLFRNIVAPAGQLAGPAVLMWNQSSGTITEGNTFLNCARGIAYGLQDVAGSDHRGGRIRNNFFYRSAAQPGDAALLVYDSPSTQVLNNTVLLSGTYANAIEYRFAGTTGVLVKNNLTDAAIAARDGATGSVNTNLTNATAAMFVNAAAGDLHLLATATAAIDRGTTVSGNVDDWDGQARPQNGRYDIGADERTGAATPSQTFTLTVAGGSGSGSYPAATVVSITAAAPPSGQSFSRWTGAAVQSATSATTTLTMPAANATVTATYAAAGSPPPAAFTLTVVGGTGSGSYSAATVVPIAAGTPPSGQAFSRWTGAAVQSATSATTTLTMPAANATVTATYAAAAPPPSPNFVTGMKEICSFKLPAGSFGGVNGGFDYGGSAIAFNAARGTLLVVGHIYDQRTAEVTIPACGGTSSVVANFTDDLEGKLGSVGSGTTLIGGQLFYGGKLFVTGFVYYDGAGAQTLSHFVRPADLSVKGQVTGPFRVGPLGAGFYSGYMAPVPADWQAQLGGPALTGNCCLSIISRTSYGPSVSSFDPDRPGSAIELVGYDQAHQTLGQYGASGAHPAFNGTTRVKGIVFPAGTSSVLFIGRTGLGNYCYGEAAACGDNTNNSKGEHAAPYAMYAWAYDANDLAAVKSGLKQPWQVVPYAQWTLPGSGDSEYSGAAAYDPATGRIFVSEESGNGTLPVIHVFQVQ